MDTTSPDSQALPQGTHLHEFVIERVLGSGGFGITYLARDTSLGRQVVIKENLPTQFVWRETATGTVRPRHSTGGDTDDFEWSMKNFLREAETLASLDHPGIVRVLRKFETNGTAYFVMPFVEGVPFDSLIEERSSKNKPFSQDELLGLTTRVLDAFGYLHRSNIYHRDIKPGNILVTMDGIPVLIDFGSARQSIGERSMTVIESAGYTPFEQLQSRGNIGPWSDLYAFGATLAKAITFETPPKAADRMMGDPWPGLLGDSRCASFSDWFLQAIDRSMAVDPAQRWQSAREWTGFLNGGASMPAATSATSLPPPIAPPVPPSKVHAAVPHTPASGNGTSRPSRAIKATLVAAGITFVGTLLRPETIYDRMGGTSRGFATILGETLGGLIGVAVIAILVSLLIAGIMTAFKKPFAVSISRGYSLGILIVAGLVCIGNLVSRSYRPTADTIYAKAEAQSARNMISGLEDDIHKMIAEGTGSDGLPKETDFRFEKKSSPTDDMAKMRELMQSFFNEMITLQNDYLAALDKDGLNTLLDANRAAKDTNFVESKAILERSRKTVLEFRAKANGIVANFPKLINDYSFDEKLNVELLSGYKKGVGKVLPLLKESWDLEVAVIGHMDDLIEHLEAARSHWIPEDEKFMFERDEDLDKFNAILAKITACVDRQTEIKQNTQTSAMGNIEKLKARVTE